MCKTKRSYLLHLSSEYADSYRLGNQSRFKSNILEPIEIQHDETAYVSIRHARIPNLLPQISDDNNEFRIVNTGSGVSTTFVIGRGNYTGPQLAAEITSMFLAVYGNNVSVTFNSPTGEFAFINGTLLNFSLQWVVGQTTGLLLGFDDSENYVWGANQSIFSQIVALLNPTPEIYLHSDLTLSHTYDNRINSRSSILEVFPITGFPMGEELFFSNLNTEFRAELVGSNISTIELWLTDRKYKEIDFIYPDKHYTISLLIQIE
jgi:hypothetical protein